MIVCDFCDSPDVEFANQDDSEHYCKECFESLDTDYIEFNHIKKW